MLDLRHMAQALGGDVVGPQVLCPGPGHSPRDRSLSVRPSLEASDGFIVHSYCGDDWRACRDHVYALLGLRPTKTKGVLPKIIRLRKSEIDDAEQKRRKAAHLWQCRKPIEGSPVETYLREARGYRGAFPATLGYLEPGAYRWPAMIAAFGVADEFEPGVLAPPSDLRGIHLTFIQPDGSGKAAIDRPKVMLGPSSGFPIVVAPPNDLLGLAITEGVEDALSANEATGLGAWAAGSAGRMPALAPIVPAYIIESVTVCGHRDEAGKRGAYGLADALISRGIEVFIEGLD